MAESNDRADRANGGLPPSRNEGPGATGHGNATHAFCNEVVASITAANKNVNGTSAGGAVGAMMLGEALLAGVTGSRWHGCTGTRVHLTVNESARLPERVPGQTIQTILKAVRKNRSFGS